MAGGAVALVAALVLGLWGAGVFGGGSAGDDIAETTAAPSAAVFADDLPYGGGIVECERWSEETGPEFNAISIAAEGGEKGLPYRTNIGDVLVWNSMDLTLVSVWICMDPDATREEITDTATVIAQNIKAGYPQQSEIATLTVRYLGTGQVPLKDLRLYWPDSTFSRDLPLADQRDQWEWDDDPSK